MLLCFTLYYLIFYQGRTIQKLLHVQVYIRHGIRTQYFGHWNPNQWRVDELGQLTSGGIRQMYYLGKNIKKDYYEKLYSEKERTFKSNVHIRCTDFDRSLMSAHALSFAIFEQQNNIPIPKNLISKSLPPIFDIENARFLDRTNIGLPNGYWPAPYHTIPKNTDSLLFGWDPAPCPVITLLNDKNQKSEEMKQANSDWQPFFKVLRAQNLTVFNLIQGGEIGDDLFSSIKNGEQLPDLTQIDYLALDYVRNVYYQITDFNHYNQVRFQATPFIKNVIQRMDQWNSTKLLIYIGHDNNIFQILNLLNLTNWKCVHDKAMATLPYFEKKESQPKSTCDITDYPLFGSQAAFELWTYSEREQTDSENFFVKFKYNGKYYPICKERLVQCPYTKFKIQLTSLIFEDYQEKCRIQGISSQSKEATIMIFTIVLFMFAFLFLVVGFNYKKQQELDLLDESQQRESEREMVLHKQ